MNIEGDFKLCVHIGFHANRSKNKKKTLIVQNLHWFLQKMKFRPRKTIFINFLKFSDNCYSF